MIEAILDRALEGRELSAEDGAALFTAEGHDLDRLISAADGLRRRSVGERVAYVINRNVNFTNVCVKRCGFCAFSRGHRAEQGYFLPAEEISRRVREARDLGATEVCIQAGLPPRIDGSFYIDLCRAIKKEIPEIHVHAFSPEEILYGATLSNRSIEDYLKALKDVGLGSLPGTSAEILDDRIREIISPGRISTRDWMTVIRTAHQVGHSDHVHHHVRAHRDVLWIGPGTWNCCAGFKRKRAASPNSFRSASSRPKRRW